MRFREIGTQADCRRPFLHWPTWMSELRAERYRSNWGVFIVTMAMCALSAGKLADGGVQGAAPTLKARATTLASECYHAAVQAVRRDDDFDLGDGTDLVPLLKARAILSSTCLQAGNLNAALAHNGEYSILSALAGFHDEANWPSDLTEIQRQERRRLVSTSDRSLLWLMEVLVRVPGRPLHLDSLRACPATPRGTRKCPVPR